ncbi:MAG: hypothetical protein FWH38_05240 [Treponema sp.]|nr:hypothetical protein [Treponema sp.]
MAVFKTLNAKKKEYVFDFLGNRSDPKPAKAVFSRFPLPDERFMPAAAASLFDGIDIAKAARRDEAELQKLSKAFAGFFTANATKIDLEAFARECIDRFEDFRFVDENGNAKEVRAVEDFLSINRQAMAAIALDCYRYARTEDEFTMGE